MKMDESDWARMYGKTPTVYGESKMIQIEKNYKLTLTENQARELYNFLSDQKKYGQITPDTEITLIYYELKKLFDTGIR
jgi:uncharacterized protein YpuA (DUF1002 family)